ncbi:hypothetical protein [Pseudonocardia phyllosphaerae]|uniref:hypothetical protein n=1 Tax=Pseudonocardia phyllosphaerae TaxID=3390502 RepID=UPI0039795675
MFAPSPGGIVTLVIVLVAVVAALVSPPGRKAAATAVDSVVRWPSLIRSELRGNAPLADEPRHDTTTPDIPVVPEPGPDVRETDVHAPIDAAPIDAAPIDAALVEAPTPTRGFPRVGPPRH